MNDPVSGTYPSAPEDIALRLDPPPRAEGRETVTSLTLCGNHESTIRQCLEHLTWCDEILVVMDSRSSDGTREIVREYTDRIFEREFIAAGDQRNFAIPKASCDWVMAVDSDEIISPQLRDDILAKLKDPGGYDAFYVKRAVYFRGKPIKRCGWGNEKQLRLFRRDKARYDDRRAHAKARIKGPIGQINSFMYHDTIRDFSGYLERFNDFTSRTSADLWEKGKRATLPRLLLRPAARFMKMYVVRLGFLDGMRGLLMSVFSAFHVFTKYAKLWEIQNSRTDKRGPEA